MNIDTLNLKQNIYPTRFDIDPYRGVVIFMKDGIYEFNHNSGTWRKI